MTIHRHAAKRFWGIVAFTCSEASLVPFRPASSPVFIQWSPFRADFPLRARGFATVQGKGRPISLDGTRNSRLALASAPQSGHAKQQKQPKQSTKNEDLTPKAAKAPKGCRSNEVRSKTGSMWQLLVGKSAADNDKLSLEEGRSHETWMHVASSPGSHLVVRAIPAEDIRSPPSDVLLIAARICTWYSKLRDQKNIQVHVTTCGKISKVRGAPAGQVMLRGGFQTLKVSALDPSSLLGVAAGSAGTGAKTKQR
eukprot:TRINITY_DN32455_c0_g1_i1.p1 TRINITY_DN32455_c0_g1~~TRINITY_DN32455_c0_g1_i1.p1  ORF type:complete len:253 (+),score=14.49 TRINITY_DN32455_c0_g1_i1:43-801(+)